MKTLRELEGTKTPLQESHGPKRSNDPGHLISHTFPPRFAPFVPALFSSCLAFFFAAKKENEAAVAWWPHLAWPIS